MKEEPLMKAYDNLDDFIADMPALAERARGRLQGHDGRFRLETKEGRRLNLTLQNGALTVAPADDSPVDCSVKAAESDLLAVVQGKLSPAKALLFGKLRVQGSPAKLWELIRLL
ncbi:MAG: SCP2 sterol-binding domain-containing protein [Clostridia bacterium]|nr:SCP2 sterol-binding domain-containing protein [Clostridia bacterium]